MYIEEYGKAKNYPKELDSSGNGVSDRWMGGMGVYASIGELGVGVF